MINIPFSPILESTQIDHSGATIQPVDNTSEPIEEKLERNMEESEANPKPRVLSLFEEAVKGMIIL